MELKVTVQKIHIANQFVVYYQARQMGKSINFILNTNVKRKWICLEILRNLLSHPNVRVSFNDKGTYLTSILYCPHDQLLLSADHASGSAFTHDVKFDEKWSCWCNMWNFCKYKLCDSVHVVCIGTVNAQNLKNKINRFENTSLRGSFNWILIQNNNPYSGIHKECSKNVPKTFHND